MLLARRLVEAGVRLVTVDLRWWDTHVKGFESLKDGFLTRWDHCYSALIEDLHQRLVVNLRLAVAVFLNGDLKSAQQLIAEKVTFRELEMQYADSHLQRLSDRTPQSMETSSLHLDLLSDFKRINSLFCSVAYPILESAGVLSKTRLLGTPQARDRGSDAAVPLDSPSPG